MSGQSLSSCLARLSAAEHDPAALGRALSELRSRHVSRAGGAGLFRKGGGLVLLVALLTEPAKAAALGASRRNLELALSLLANCCTEPGSRLQVRQLGGIPPLVCILQSVCVDSIWNRLSRALGNLALDPQNCNLIHQSGAVVTLVQILQNSQDGGCLQSCLRALRILGSSPPHRLSICQLGGLTRCTQMLASEDPDVVCAAARAACELSRCCSLDCAEQLSPAVPALVRLAGGEEVKAVVREAALGTLCNLCSQGALRPMLGSAGAIQLLITEVRTLLEAPTRCLPLVRALCLCCREAINRIRVRELGGLELLLKLLRDPQYRSAHHRITVAFLHYCHDVAALTLLAVGGMATLLATRLQEVARAAREQSSAPDVPEAPDEEEEPEGSTSFDFPPEPKKKQQSGSSEDSLRSWLLEEGYISSPDDLPPEWILERDHRDEPSSCSADKATSPQDKSGRCRNPSGLGKRDPMPHASPQLSSPTLQPCQSPIHEILASPSPLGPRTPRPSEVWSPEFPILLLLSRLSQLSDPGTCLISHSILNGLLTYITCHPQPSSRAAHLLLRLTCDPACLEAFIRTGGVCTLRERLLLSVETSNRLRMRRLGRVLLRNLGIQAESPFGLGLVSHMLLTGSPSDRQQCALCLPFIYRKDSAQRQHLLDSALRLVLEPLMTSVDPVFFFHAAECLSSILTPQVSPTAPASPPPASCACSYEERFSLGPADVVFVLDEGVRLLGSREVLSRGCEVFCAMLQGGYAESQQHEVRMREVPSCAFLPLLHHLHGCEAACPTLQHLRHIEPGQELLCSPLASTLAAAGRFLLPNLQRVLEDAVCERLLSLDSLPSVYHFAEIHESPRLRRDCCVFLLRRPHSSHKRAQALLQLCETAQDKSQLVQHLEDATRE